MLSTTSGTTSLPPSTDSLSSGRPRRPNRHRHGRCRFSSPQREESVDFGLLIGVGERRDVEMESVLAELRVQRCATPRDHRTGEVRRADRTLVVLIPDQRPAKPAVQKYPTARVPSHVIDPRRPQVERKLLVGSMMQSSLPSGSASTTCSSSGP